METKEELVSVGGCNSAARRSARTGGCRTLASGPPGGPACTTTLTYFVHNHYLLPRHTCSPVRAAQTVPLDHADIHAARLRTPLSVAPQPSWMPFCQNGIWCVSYAETAVIHSILNLLFRCAHSCLTRPFSLVSLHVGSQETGGGFRAHY